MQQQTVSAYKQPKAFYILFFVEMWERFGYYGLQALLILYLSKVFNFSDNKAYGTFAAFAALVYATPFLGGFIGDKLIGYHRSLTIGSLMLMCGYFMLSIPTQLLDAHGSQILFYLALGTIVAGNGFFKTSPASLLGKIYGPDDIRVDSGFTLFYMSINVGSLISMALCGYIAKAISWQAGFATCAIGLALGTITFFMSKKLIANYGSPADFEPLKKKYILPLTTGTLIVIVASALLIRYLGFTQWILSFVMLGAVLFYGILIKRTNNLERTKLIACFILTIFAIVFYCLYFQAPQSINLYVDRNVDHHIFGLFVPTASFQSLNPFWILVLAPCLSAFYKKMESNRGDFSLPVKFAAGIFIMGLGFMVLYISKFYADATHHVSAWWVVLSFFLQSFGELLVSALGLAMITKLAPPQFIAVMMGTWYLSTSAAAYLSGLLAKLASVPQGITDPAASLKIYSHVFYQFGWITMLIGLLVFCTAPLLKKLIIGSNRKVHITVKNPTA
ncbi:MAG: dipeptide/tripeptide permease [Legionellales bacterium]|nr:dipeptide/tripeptide permease [Legionellales bacterium]